VGEIAAPRFPALETATLSNGLKVIVARRPDVPVVNFNLVADAGFAADQGAKPGTATLAMNMLDEGTRTRDALRISSDLANLGATIGTSSNLDASSVTLSALKTNLDPSLDLYADVIMNPAFPQADLDRLKALQIATIQREKTEPTSAGLRVLPRIIYGANHAYSLPYSGSGTEQSVQALTRDDLVRFTGTWLKPNNATLVVVGDTSLAEIRPKLEARLAGWRPGQAPVKNIAAVQAPARNTVYVIDKPGAAQTVLLAAIPAPPRANPDEVAIESFNVALGGAFTSRLNMNLREDKGWSYGARTFVRNSRGPRLFIASAPVQTGQDQGKPGRDAQGAARHHQGSRHHRRRAEPGAEQPLAAPARPLGDQCGRLQRHHRAGDLRPARRLLGHLRPGGEGHDGERPQPRRRSMSCAPTPSPSSSSATGPRSTRACAS
jgi:zinc protease